MLADNCTVRKTFSAIEHKAFDLNTSFLFKNTVCISQPDVRCKVRNEGQSY